MIFPEGTQLFIADATGDAATLIEVQGFSEIGDIGLATELIDVTVISDKSPKSRASNRKTDTNRDLICRYEPDDQGQVHIMAACNAKEVRKCEIRLPDIAKPWAFSAYFGGFNHSKLEEQKSLTLVAKINIEEETGVLS